MSNYDADLQINEAAVVQSLNPCFPDIWSRILQKFSHASNILKVHKA